VGEGFIPPMVRPYTRWWTRGGVTNQTFTGAWLLPMHLSAPSRSCSGQRDNGSARLHVDSTTHAKCLAAPRRHGQSDMRIRHTTSKPPSCCYPLPSHRSAVSSAWHGGAAALVLLSRHWHSAFSDLGDAQAVRAARRRQLAPLRDGPVVGRPGPGAAGPVVRAEVAVVVQRHPPGHAGEVVDEHVKREHVDPLAAAAALEVQIVRPKNPRASRRP
jgi:hypothetical protein